MTTLTTASTETTVRTLRKGEPMPEHIGEPFLKIASIDPDWIWVAEYEGEVIGIIIAAYCHGFALVLRVKMEPDAPRPALLILLRRFFSDLRKRGLVGYVSWFEDKSYDEQTLRRISESLGGIVQSRPSVIVASLLPKEDV